MFVSRVAKCICSICRPERLKPIAQRLGMDPDAISENVSVPADMWLRLKVRLYLRMWAPILSHK